MFRIESDKATRHEDSPSRSRQKEDLRESAFGFAKGSYIGRDETIVERRPRKFGKNIPCGSSEDLFRIRIKDTRRQGAGPGSSADPNERQFLGALRIEALEQRNDHCPGNAPAHDRNSLGHVNTV